MGEITEDIVDGSSCSGCGVCFVAAHGFPVLCQSCWREWGPINRETAGMTLATERELG